jgi:acetyltransferase-like isoleucine patch superfamily enzyme
MFGKILRFTKSLRNVNLLKTILFNFKLLPFRQAIYLPIFLYGRVSLNKTSGSVSVALLHPGIVKIGLTNSQNFGRDTSQKTKLNVSGSLTFGRGVLISNGTQIYVKKGATLTLGDDVHIGPLSKICCENSIRIGDTVRISWEAQIFDTDFHYMIDNNNMVRRRGAPVVIGNHVWIGNRATINKRSHISDWQIVASNSLVNKDFSQHEQGILVGSPATWIPSTKRRIFSRDKEFIIDDYFSRNTNAMEYNYQ